MIGAIHHRVTQLNKIDMIERTKLKSNLALANSRIEKIERMIYSQEDLDTWLIRHLYLMLNIYRSVKISCEVLLSMEN